MSNVTAQIAPKSMVTDALWLLGMLLVLTTDFTTLFCAITGVRTAPNIKVLPPGRRVRISNGYFQMGSLPITHVTSARVHVDFDVSKPKIVSSETKCIDTRAVFGLEMKRMIP